VGHPLSLLVIPWHLPYNWGKSQECGPCLVFASYILAFALLLRKKPRVRAVPRLCELYPGICLTTEENAKSAGRASSLRTISRHLPYNWGKNQECGPCPVFASYTLAFALQLRKKPRKNLSHGSRKVPVGTMKTEYTEQNRKCCAFCYTGTDCYIFLTLHLGIILVKNQLDAQFFF